MRVTLKNKENVVLNRNGAISINDAQGREFERYSLPQGAFITFADGQEVKKGVSLVHWDPYTLPVLTEVAGSVRFEDLRENVTMREEINPVTKLSERVVVEHKPEYHPQVVILDDKKEVLGIYPIPIGAHIIVRDGEKVGGGDLLAKIPRTVVPSVAAARRTSVSRCSIASAGRWTMIDTRRPVPTLLRCDVR